MFLKLTKIRVVGVSLNFRNIGVTSYLYMFIFMNFYRLDQLLIGFEEGYIDRCIFCLIFVK